MAKLSLNELLTVINRVEGEMHEALRDFQRGAFETYKKTALIDEKIVMEAITDEEHLGYLTRAHELHDLLEVLKELRRSTNRETKIQYRDGEVTKETSIADGIELAKFLQTLHNSHKSLTRFNPKNVYANQAENNVTEYTHDIEGYKVKAKELLKTKDSITQAITKANVEVVVEVEGVEEFL